MFQRNGAFGNACTRLVIPAICWNIGKIWFLRCLMLIDWYFRIIVITLTCLSTVECQWPYVGDKTKDCEDRQEQTAPAELIWCAHRSRAYSAHCRSWNYGREMNTCHAASYMRVAAAAARKLISSRVATTRLITIFCYTHKFRRGNAIISPAANFEEIVWKPVTLSVSLSVYLLISYEKLLDGRTNAYRPSPRPCREQQTFHVLHLTFPSFLETISLKQSNDIIMMKHRHRSMV